jgi:hypothetical protein
MSVKTTVSVGKMSPKHLEAGIARYFRKALVAQELVKGDTSVTFQKGPGRVKMHGSEKAEANFGVISFSDTEYQVGINEREGNFSFVYDSWVSTPTGSLTSRVDGQGARNSGTNLVHCEMAEKARKFTIDQGRAFNVEFQKAGGAKIFVPNA